MGGSRFPAIVGALLFTGVCAYFFCGLYSAVDPVEIERVQRRTVSESARLDGIAVRSERLLSSSRVCSVLAGDGQRVPAGAALAESGGESLCAPCSAVFFSEFDGLEYLTPDCCEELSVESLRALTESLPASAGSAYGRLVTEQVWFFAAFTDVPLPEGKRCTVRFDGIEGSTKALVMSVSGQEDGQYAVLLRLNCGGDHLKLRKAGAELIFNSVSGLALPSSAVRHDEQGDYVFTVKSGMAERTPVEIIYSSGQLCIAADGASKGLTEGGSVIAYGKGIY